ncbi:MAG: protoheme IX farnesyltransferase [Planctomycetaceae bacterium]|nr:protoheme IX farnesyltransferase [Planctomycetaceae bacterium]
MMKATLAGEAELQQYASGGRAVAAPVAIRSRLADYLELTKPRIAVMALFTVAAGYWLGAGSEATTRVLLNTLLGAGLVAAGGSALNQVFERRTDARMRRTANRPLPAGRVSPEQAAVFGAVTSGIGLAYLMATVPPAATIAAALTLVSYALIYTPLKTVTQWNTVIGAVPGALPPVIGWCAAQGWDGAGGATALFLILFVWQLPHFLAIAWMYRADYAGAGLQMLPGTDSTGKRTAVVMVVTAAALIPVAFVAVWVGMAGWVYAVGATLLGVMFVRKTLDFARDRSDRQARRVLRASLVYLPGVLALLLIDALLLK